MLLILCIIMAQVTNDQIVHNKYIWAEQDVQEFLEDIKQDGCVSSEAAETLKQSLVTDLNLEDDSDIVIEAVAPSMAGVPVTRGNLIYVRVEYPMENVIAGGKLLGITDENNVSKRILNTSVYSEYIVW